MGTKVTIRNSNTSPSLTFSTWSLIHESPPYLLGPWEGLLAQGEPHTPRGFQGTAEEIAGTTGPV